MIDYEISERKKDIEQIDKEKSELQKDIEEKIRLANTLIQKEKDILEKKIIENLNNSEKKFKEIH